MLTNSLSLLVSMPTPKTLSPVILHTFSVKNCTTQIEERRKKKKKKTLHGRSSSKPQKIQLPTPNMEPSSIPTKKVLVPIGFGTEEIETVIVTDILRRAGAAVTVASVEDQLQVEAFGGTRLMADEFISSCSDEVFDLVVLPGGMPGSTRLRDSKVLQDITRKQAEGKRLYAAICAAPAVTLLPWGLIKRKQTTCHPAFMDKLPTFWAVKSNLQVSGELTTSRGPGTSFEFAFSLVQQLFGESMAKTICENMLFDEDRTVEECNEVSSWSLDHAPRVLVPVGNGSEEIELVTVIDVLRRAKANVTVASVEKSLQILAANGTKIIADKTINDVTDSIYDLIIVPGEKPGAERLHKSRILKNLLKQQQSAERMIGAMSSSPSILQKHGLLKDKQFTAHPSFSSTVDEAAMVSNNNARTVIDGKLITGKGRSASMDFALTIVGKLFGEDRARSVAGGLVFEYPS